MCTGFDHPFGKPASMPVISPPSTSRCRSGEMGSTPDVGPSDFRPHRIDEALSLLPPTVDPASTSPYLLATLGELAATMPRVGLRSFYRHFAAGLFLCLLLLHVPRCHCFIVRLACVIHGHFATPPKSSLCNSPSAERVSFLERQSQLLA